MLSYVMLCCAAYINSIKCIRNDSRHVLVKYFLSVCVVKLFLTACSLEGLGELKILVVIACCYITEDSHLIFRALVPIFSCVVPEMKVVSHQKDLELAWSTLIRPRGVSSCSHNNYAFKELVAGIIMNIQKMIDFFVLG